MAAIAAGLHMLATERGRPTPAADELARYIDAAVPPAQTGSGPRLAGAAPVPGEVGPPPVSRSENDPSRHPPGEHVLHELIHLVELALDRDDAGATCGMQGEDVGQVVARTDDRSDDRLAAQDQVEDRQGHARVTSREPDAHQSAAAPQRAEGLVEGSGRGRERDRVIGAAQRLDRCDPVLGVRALTTWSAPSSVAIASFVSSTSTPTTNPPASRAYCTARCPRPPTPKTATVSAAAT